MYIGVQMSISSRNEKLYATALAVIPAAGALLANVGPVHNAVGIGTLFALQGSGYEHPATVVIPGIASAVSNHPSPPLIVLEEPGLVSVIVGSVCIAAVAVYVGRSVAGSASAPPRPLRVWTGHCPNSVMNVALIVPAPGPPVMYGWG